MSLAESGNIRAQTILAAADREGVVCLEHAGNINAERAVHAVTAAGAGDSFVFAVGLESGFQDVYKRQLRPCLNLRTCTSLRRMVNQIPVPHSRTSRMASHIQVLTVLTTEVRPFTNCVAKSTVFPPVSCCDKVKKCLRLSIAKGIQTRNDFQNFCRNFPITANFDGFVN